ncbi:MAG: hypothetical protein AAGK78_14445 [Planctomycetota bacterium]
MRAPLRQLAVGRRLGGRWCRRRIAIFVGGLDFGGHFIDFDVVVHLAFLIKT